MTGVPADGGGPLDQRVARLYWITDDHGKRIAKLEDSGLIQFMTEVRYDLNAVKGKLGRMDSKVDGMKAVVDDLAAKDEGEEAVNRHKGDVITRTVMPLIAAGGVLIALLALLLR